MAGIRAISGARPGVLIAPDPVSFPAFPRRGGNETIFVTRRTVSSTGHLDNSTARITIWSPGTNGADGPFLFMDGLAPGAVLAKIMRYG